MTLLVLMEYVTKDYNLQMIRQNVRPSLKLVRHFYAVSEHYGIDRAKYGMNKIRKWKAWQALHSGSGSQHKHLASSYWWKLMLFMAM